MSKGETAVSSRRGAKPRIGLSADWGFHAGELAVQQRAGVRAEAARLEPMLEPGELGGGFAQFLAERTFAVLSARDGLGRLWASPLVGPAGFMAVDSPTSLLISASISDGDPLLGLPSGQPVGMIALEFALRRRVRLNGVLTEAGPGRLVIEVREAYGNCPQYIQQRVLRLDERTAGKPRAFREAAAFSAADADLIRRADTFFLGTTHPGRGNDASHRGGAPGFVRVEGNQLWWPDYRGNNMFNSFGNLAVDPEAALLFIDFGTGSTLHLSGTASVEWEQLGNPGDDDGTARRARFSLERLVAGHALPAHEIAHASYPRNPTVAG
jgi:predicted pyridoxine 5'-phosphate oxidase superfamily flavin-nucleotide-binding protein